MSGTQVIDAADALYGGHRLQPEHFEPAHVPIEVARFGTEAHTLGVGAPGKVGILELDFELRGSTGAERTELVHHYQKSPLQIMRPLYYNPLRPDMPYTYVMMTGGGVLHGDRQRTDLNFGEGTSAHVTTQAHGKIYRMESGYATALVNIGAAAGSYVEYLPDPTILFAGSRLYQRISASVDRDATLLIGDTIYGGRLTRGEHHEYDVFASDLEIRRPDGSPVAFDRVRLVPRDGRVGGLGVLDGRDIVTTFAVISPAAPAREIAEVLHTAVRGSLQSTASEDDDTRFGVSVLPHDAGAWLRLITDDTIVAVAAQREAAAAVHRLLTGNAAPVIRKS